MAVLGAQPVGGPLDRFPQLNYVLGVSTNGPGVTPDEKPVTPATPEALDQRCYPGGFLFSRGMA